MLPHSSSIFIAFIMHTLSRKAIDGNVSISDGGFEFSGQVIQCGKDQHDSVTGETDDEIWSMEIGSAHSMTELRHALPDHTPDLLSTKLALPHLRHAWMPRESLFTVLDKGLELPLTLLSAPAGFGKTTLVRAWIAARNADQERFDAAWLSLDGGDNDPVRFWHYVIAACQHFDSSVGWSAMERLHAVQPFVFEQSGQLSFEAILTLLINDLAALTGQRVLVLEDYHAIVLSQIHQLFAYFLDHLPATVHVILLSRSDLPLPLTRLRARGALLELRSSDICFSLEETRRFFHQTLSFPLAEDAIALLHERTEGWGAGLNLVALALCRYAAAQEREHFIQTLSGGYRPLLEYLVNDVLDMQPEQLQMFLLQTSGLACLTGSLCDAVTGRTDSELLLEQIERANLFLEPLDGAGQWYRYHTLFAEAMQHEARRRLGTEALRTCLLRASNWYEQQNQPMEAIETALLAEDFARVVVLIERVGGSIYTLKINEYFTLRRWLEQIPRTMLQDRPDLYLIYISLQMFDRSGRVIRGSAQFEKVDTLLRTAEQLWSSEQETAQLSIVHTFRALLAGWQQDFKQAGAFARQALGYHGGQMEGDMSWRSACLSLIAAEEHFFGSMDKARQLVLESLELNQQTIKNPYADRAIRLGLGELYMRLGELRQAAETFRYILTRAEDDFFDRSKALAGLAQLSYEWNLLDVATRQAQKALDLGHHIQDEELQIQAELVLARVEYARGNINQALLQIVELVARARMHPLPLLARTVLFWQARLQLASGNLAAVQRRLDQCAVDEDKVPFFMLMQEDLLAVRCMLVRGETQQALQLLEADLPKAQQHAYIEGVIQTQLLLAQAYYQQHNVSAARHFLQELLPQARSRGYQRLFLDEGEIIAVLLRACDEDHRGKQLLAAPLPVSPSVIEPLTVQEQRVLRLLLAGLSKPEIAQELVVSTNTVKTHMRHIYQKLNVTSRAEARETVQRLHLL
jgi:LuxR family maltose regulon positive regulatory protein